MLVETCISFWTPFKAYELHGREAKALLQLGLFLEKWQGWSLSRGGLDDDFWRRISRRICPQRGLALICVNLLHRRIFAPCRSTTMTAYASLRISGGHHGKARLFIVHVVATGVPRLCKDKPHVPRITEFGSYRKEHLRSTGILSGTYFYFKKETNSWGHMCTHNAWSASCLSFPLNPKNQAIH